MRVELNGIEKELRHFKDVIQEVAVEYIDEKLIAYIVPSVRMSIDQLKENIQQYLKKTNLPKEAYPNFYIPLNGIQLNKNGKIDTKALPALNSILKSINKPQNDLETNLLNLWSRVLKLDKELIDINTSFVSLGGTSSRMKNLMANLQADFFSNDQYQTLKINFEIQENITIAELASAIQELNDNYKELLPHIKAIKKDEHLEFKRPNITFSFIKPEPRPRYFIEGNKLTYPDTTLNPDNHPSKYANIRRRH